MVRSDPNESTRAKKNRIFRKNRIVKEREEAPGEVQKRRPRMKSGRREPPVDERMEHHFAQLSIAPSALRFVYVFAKALITNES